MRIVLLIYLVVSVLTAVLSYGAAVEATSIAKKRNPDKVWPHHSLLSRLLGLLRASIICLVPLLNVGILLHICLNWDKNLEMVAADVERKLISKEVAA